MGPVFPQVDRRAPWGDLRHPGDEQAESPPGQRASWNRPVTRRKHAPANGRISLLSVASRALRASGRCQIKKVIFPEKNQLQAWLRCRIGRAPYAKVLPLYRHEPLLRGVLSPPGAGIGVLRAESEICLYRCFRQKAVRRSRGQILSKEDR